MAKWLRKIAVLFALLFFGYVLGHENSIYTYRLPDGWFVETFADAHLVTPLRNGDSILSRPINMEKGPTTYVLEDGWVLRIENVSQVGG